MKNRRRSKSPGASSESRVETRIRHLSRICYVIAVVTKRWVYSKSECHTTTIAPVSLRTINRKCIGLPLGYCGTAEQYCNYESEQDKCTRKISHKLRSAPVASCIRNLSRLRTLQ